MPAPLIPFDLMDWITQHQEEFPKPVGIKVLWQNSEFVAFCAGGNSRNDFHINPGDELFLQLKGDIRVDLQIDGERVMNPVREGEVLLVPAGVPHAPRRPAGTWGLVVERERRPDELDRFAWHCERCNTQLNTVEFHLKDIETEFGRKLKEYDADEAGRTCPVCGTILNVYEEFTMDSQLVPVARSAR